MGEAKTYRLSRSLRAFLVLFAVMFVFVVGGIASKIVQGTQPLEGVVFFVVWLILAFAMFTYQAFRGVTPFVRHTGGKIRLLGPFDGFHDLLTRLKEKNPSIEIKRL